MKPIDQNPVVDFSAIFSPRSIAIVGAPRGPKAGSVFLQGLLDQGYEGKIFPVNPHGEFIQGLRAYPSLQEIPGEVDLAILLVPASEVLPILRECGAKGIKAAVIHTSGFSESGDGEGEKREQDLLQAARKMNLRLIGPNCMGIYHPRNKMAFFAGMPKTSGKVGVISQSGSLAILISRVAEPLGMHFSKIVSSGNEIDLSSADFLEYLAEDPETELIGAYLEGVKDGPAFLQALQRASRKKPVVIWKAGRTRGGARAAFSHTGSLAGSQAAWDGLKKQCRILMARNLDELVDILAAFYHLPVGVGGRLAILSGPGGAAVAAADACEEFGLEVAQLGAETREHLQKILPGAGTSSRNPVDMGLSPLFKVDLYAQAAKIVGRDPGVDGLIFQGRGLTPALNLRYAQTLAEAQREIRKPFLAVALGGLYLEQEARNILTKAGIPVYSSAERALWAYTALYRYGQRRRQEG
jgi:acyl-CoA synthetase (NDP forming)